MLYIDDQVLMAGLLRAPIPRMAQPLLGFVRVSEILDTARKLSNDLRRSVRRVVVHDDDFDGEFERNLPLDAFQHAGDKADPMQNAA